MDGSFDIQDFVARVLAEDLGEGGDVTSNATIAPEAQFRAVINCREAIVVAGLEVAAAFFPALDADVRIEPLVNDGDHAPAGTELMRLRGKRPPTLPAEPSAAN